MTRPVSPSGWRILAALKRAEVAGVTRYTDEFHPAARDALVARGLVSVDGPRLSLTDEGRAEVPA